MNMIVLNCPNVCRTHSWLLMDNSPRKKNKEEQNVKRKVEGKRDRRINDDKKDERYDYGGMVEPNPPEHVGTEQDVRRFSNPAR